MSGKQKLYARIPAQAAGLLSDESGPIANAANLSALLFMELDEVNWVGFYFLQGAELVLGPLQGQPAFVRIGRGQGVVGSAAASRQTLKVHNVDQFSRLSAGPRPGERENVIPLLKDGALLGVLDLDSPRLARFDRFDQHGLEALADLYLANSD